MKEEAQKKEIQIKGWEAFDRIFVLEEVFGTDLDVISEKMVDYFSKPENSQDLSSLLTALVYSEKSKLEFIRQKDIAEEMANKLISDNQSQPKQLGFLDVEEFNLKECEGCPDFDVCLEKYEEAIKSELNDKRLN